MMLLENLSNLINWVAQVRKEETDKNGSELVSDDEWRRFMCLVGDRGLGLVGYGFWHVTDLSGRETLVRVTVHYVVTFLDGSQFDLSQDRGTPFKFKLDQDRGQPADAYDGVRAKVTYALKNKFWIKVCYFLVRASMAPPSKGSEEDLKSSKEEERGSLFDSAGSSGSENGQKSYQ